MHTDDHIRTVDLCTDVFRAASRDGLSSPVYLPVGRIRPLLCAVAQGAGHRSVRNAQNEKCANKCQCRFHVDALPLVERVSIRCLGSQKFVHAVSVVSHSAPPVMSAYLASATEMADSCSDATFRSLALSASLNPASRLHSWLR